MGEKELMPPNLPAQQLEARAGMSAIGWGDYPMSMMVESVAGLQQAVFANIVRTFVKRGFTLLLAEDDEADAMLFTRVLEESSQKAAISVLLAVTRDGEEALAYLKGEGEFSDRTKHPFPDLVVTDLKMPRLNGLSVLRWMREHDEYQGIPKIMLSGSADESDVAEAYRLGVNTFFQKPSSLNEFRELVQQIVCYWACNQRPVIRQMARVNAGVAEGLAKRGGPLSAAI